MLGFSSFQSETRCLAMPVARPYERPRPDLGSKDTFASIRRLLIGLSHRFALDSAGLELRDSLGCYNP